MKMMFSYFLFHAAALLPLLSTRSIAVPLSKRSIIGPVIQDNFPDPSIIQVGSTYYAFSTNSGGKHVPYATSPDFNTWTVAAGQDALPTVGAWSNGNNVWAPDVLQVVSTDHDAHLAGVEKKTPQIIYCTRSDDHLPWKLTYPPRQNPSSFVMYYTANTADGATHCLGAAVSSNVEGPYSPLPDTLGDCPRR